MRKCCPLLTLLFLVCIAQAGNCQVAAIGDLNGDGKPDVAAWNGSTISVLLNDGAGNLTAAHFLGITRPFQSIQLADFNGDGHLDILVGETAPPGLAFEILFGDGTGGFSAPVSVPLAGLVPVAGPVAGDFNGDGFQDIAFSTGSSNTDVEILRGDGHGGFSIPNVNIIALEGASVQNLFVTDANKDTKPDLVVSGEVGVQAFVCYLAVNNGAGGFTSTALPASGFSESGCHPTPDLNGDGNIDFVRQFTSIFGDGQGGILYTQPRLNSIKVADGIPADYDHNGTTDYLQFHVQPEIQYFPGNGHGGFGDPITVSTSTFNVIAVADLNGDGFPDLVLQDPLNQANISVFLNPAATPVSIAVSSITQGSASAATASTAAPVKLIASVGSLNAGSPQAAGSVTFTDGATTLGSAPVNIYGNAALDFTFGAGAHSTLNAAFGGALDAATNTQFSASSSTSAAAVSVNPSAPPNAAPNVNLSTSLSPARELNPVTFTATVAPSVATTFVPSGNVVFSADGDVLGVSPLQGATAQLSTTFPNPGLHNITAAYGGDAEFPPATSGTVVEDIRAFSAPRNPSSVQLTVTPSSLGAPNQSVSLSATLAGVANPPSRFIYRVNGAFLASSPQNAQTAPRFSPTALGTYTITAEYPGDAVLAPSTGTAILAVGNPGGDFSISASPGSATVQAGQTATFTITINPANGLSATTSFSCTGLPAGSSCSFSPATLSPSGSPLSTTLTITTTARQAAALFPGNTPQRFPGWIPVFGFAVSVMLIMKLRLQRKAFRLILVPFVLALPLLLTGCGGGSSRVQTITGTPAGTSQVTVTAVSSVSHTVPITLTVQ